MWTAGVEPNAFDRRIAISTETWVCPTNSLRHGLPGDPTPRPPAQSSGRAAVRNGRPTTPSSGETPERVSPRARPSPCPRGSPSEVARRRDAPPRGCGRPQPPPLLERPPYHHSCHRPDIGAHPPTIIAHCQRRVSPYTLFQGAGIRLESGMIPATAAPASLREEPRRPPADVWRGANHPAILVPRELMRRYTATARIGWAPRRPGSLAGRTSPSEGR